MSAERPQNCDRVQLRAQLVSALAEAERCDPVVAIYVETALAMLDERSNLGDQSSAR